MTDAEIQAKILLEIAKSLARAADEATDRARAAFARIERPLPLFDTDMGGR